jgi:ribosomal-protein-alanine N-acetyltransferase
MRATAGSETPGAHARPLRAAGLAMAEFFLRSSRLGFRLWRDGDLPLALALWGDPAVSRLIAAGALSERDIRARLRQEIETQRRFRMQYWPMFLLATGEHVGCCGLRPHGDDPGRPEFGVHVRSRHWRQGFAYEGASAVIEHAFRRIGVAALFAGHNPANIGSRRLLAKLGFVYTHDEFYAPTGLQHPSYLLTRGQAPPDVPPGAAGGRGKRHGTDAGA